MHQKHTSKNATYTWLFAVLFLLQIFIFESLIKDEYEKIYLLDLKFLIVKYFSSIEKDKNFIQEQVIENIKKKNIEIVLEKHLTLNKGNLKEIKLSQ